MFSRSDSLIVCSTLPIQFDEFSFHPRGWQTGSHTKLNTSTWGACQALCFPTVLWPATCWCVVCRLDFQEQAREQVAKYAQECGVHYCDLRPLAKQVALGWQMNTFTRCPHHLTSWVSGQLWFQHVLVCFDVADLRGSLEVLSATSQWFANLSSSWRNSGCAVEGVYIYSIYRFIVMRAEGIGKTVLVICVFLKIAASWKCLFLMQANVRVIFHSCQEEKRQNAWSVLSEFKRFLNECLAEKLSL